MNLWIYAKSSHRDGLENVRRCSALAKLLNDVSPTLCSADYRAAYIANKQFGVKNTMGIDAVGNLPHTMERLDILIYDNEDVTNEMRSQMRRFCSNIYEVGKAIPYDVVDEFYFEGGNDSYEKTIFFGDDDYRKWFLDFCDGSKKYEIPIVNGAYFFVDSTEVLERYFSEVIDEEEYEDYIKNSTYLLSASVHACLESLAAGNKPVYFKRGDREIESEEMIKRYAIPIADGKNLDEVMESFDKIIKDYPQTKKIERYDISSIKSEIEESLRASSHIPSAKLY